MERTALSHGVGVRAPRGLVAPMTFAETDMRVSLYGRRALGLTVIAAGLVLAVVLSLAFGTNPLTPGEVWEGLHRRTGSEASAIVWSMRIPRTIVGIVVGAAFGVAGALIQALTRNPLADPGLLGVNAGAGFAVTIDRKSVV